MNVPIDTLAFAKNFEDAGFDHDKARVLASAFGTAQSAGREDLVTKTYLDARLAEITATLTNKIADNTAMLADKIADNTAMLADKIADNTAMLTNKLADNTAMLTKQIADNAAMLTKQIADNGRDISGRLWSTITIIAGVSTAISATIGAGVALLLHTKGI